MSAVLPVPRPSLWSLDVNPHPHPTHPVMSSTDSLLRAAFLHLEPVTAGEGALAEEPEDLGFPSSPRDNQECGLKQVSYLPVPFPHL